MNELPLNLMVVWHTGTKSFCEIIKNHKKQVEWQEASPGEQLPDQIFARMFQTAIGLANASPEALFNYTRYDQEKLVPQNPNNRPFRGSMLKTINIFKYKVRTSISGRV